VLVPNPPSVAPRTCSRSRPEQRWRRQNERLSAALKKVARTRAARDALPPRFQLTGRISNSAPLGADPAPARAGRNCSQFSALPLAASVAAVPAPAKHSRGVWCSVGYGGHVPCLLDTDVSVGVAHSAKVQRARHRYRSNASSPRSSMAPQRFDVERAPGARWRTPRTVHQESFKAPPSAGHPPSAPLSPTTTSAS
jgi:hypothetical protein